MHIREIVKYSDYKRFGSNVKIPTYEGTRGSARRRQQPDKDKAQPAAR